MSTFSYSPPSPPQLTSMFSYPTPSSPSQTNHAVARPRVSRALYGAPDPDSNSSPGQSSLPRPSSPAPLPVPPRIFSRPDEVNSPESGEDVMLLEPPSSKKPKAKKSRRPTYDEAPLAPGQKYPLSPLMRVGTLGSPGPSTTSASQGRHGPTGTTTASGHSIQVQ